MPQYDGPPYRYTTTIPPGTAALRAVIRDVYGLTRTEVVRDKSRCAASPSEHCECRAVDAFTTLKPVRRRIFDAMVRHADELGVQSVIADRRVWGFGVLRERDYTGENPHTDHTHIGLNKAGARDLTYTRVVAILRSDESPAPTQEPIMWTPEQIAAAVWEHVVQNNVDVTDDPAHRILSWAHQDANGGLESVRTILAELVAMRAELAELRRGQEG